MLSTTDLVTWLTAFGAQSSLKEGLWEFFFHFGLGFWQANEIINLLGDRVGTI